MEKAQGADPGLFCGGDVSGAKYERRTQDNACIRLFDLDIDGTPDRSANFGGATYGLGKVSSYGLVGIVSLI